MKVLPYCARVAKGRWLHDWSKQVLDMKARGKHSTFDSDTVLMLGIKWPFLETQILEIQISRSYVSIRDSDSSSNPESPYKGRRNRYTGRYVVTIHNRS